MFLFYCRKGTICRFAQPVVQADYETEEANVIEDTDTGMCEMGGHCTDKLHGYTVHQTMLKPFHYQLMHIMLKNTELLKHSKITLQHVSVYAETIFRELQSVLG